MSAFPFFIRDDISQNQSKPLDFLRRRRPSRCGGFGSPFLPSIDLGEPRFEDHKELLIAGFPARYTFEAKRQMKVFPANGNGSDHISVASLGRSAPKLMALLCPFRRAGKFRVRRWSAGFRFRSVARGICNRSE
jgi:hypothetical protein